MSNVYDIKTGLRIMQNILDSTVEQLNEPKPVKQYMHKSRYKGKSINGSSSLQLQSLGTSDKGLTLLINGKKYTYRSTRNWRADALEREFMARIAVSNRGQALAWLKRVSVVV